MPNMSYCRFENTASDLQDCFDNWEDKELNDYETRARIDIYELAQEIVMMGRPCEEPYVEDEEE